MRHQVKKIRFGHGQDANTMLMRKLVVNFLRGSHLTTTQTRAKALKMYLDSLIPHAKVKNEANKNELLSFFASSNIVKVLFDQVGPAVAKINGGYTKLTKIGYRDTDGTSMVRVEWAHPVVIDWGGKKSEKKPEAEKKVSKK